MNKNDIKLIIFTLLICIICILFTLSKKEGNQAYVYYENKLILKIDLSYDKEYTVDGYNGKVKIKVENGKIRVTNENSPYHICSKQGEINKAEDSLVCLPNKIVITIKNESNIDTIVG